MISDLIAARTQMAMSLGFHIVFAALGIAMPVLMAAAEWRWLKTQDEAYLALAKRWSKGTAILFAVGAVSGTVLSFELGLLWPSFMERAGPHRTSLRSRRVCVLHGSDLSRDLSLWLVAHFPSSAFCRRVGCCGERGRLRNLRRHSQRLDERAHRL